MEIHDMACLRATVLATTAVGLMALATRAACALAAVQSIPLQPGIARDGPRPHASPWPIYNGLDHQPTENELRALHEQDVTPAQAEVIDKLYDQLMSADKKILGSHPKLP
jgi:Spy/CpxP family protein refolding chaperone